MVEWFARLADVPAVGYPGDASVRRSTLPDHNAVPRVSSHTVDGKQFESLWWSTRDGGTTASPASRYAMAAPAHVANEAVGARLRHLREVLELPGTPSDYHFAIQQCIDELWKRRRHEPSVLAEVERLCHLDLKLIEARPATITNERDEPPRFFRVLAFAILIQLYAREGFLADAQAVAEQAARFEQAVEGEDLRARLALIADER